MTAVNLVTVSNLTKYYLTGKRGVKVHALNGISFSIKAGETVGIVGESGSGKTTLGRTVIRLMSPDEGVVTFDGRDITALSERECRKLRSQMQIVFQDPWSALNPRMKIRSLLEEPLRLHTSMSRKERADRVSELARDTQLSAEILERYPRDLSGGQLQRVCIARAIATSPRFVVFDEPTSSLDLSVRAGILQLMNELKQKNGLTSLFISHDLGTVKLVSDRILVTYLGYVVESGRSSEIFHSPKHPYTQALISAYLDPDPSKKGQRVVLQGEIPSPIDLPPGCPFATRCPIAIDQCSDKAPPLRSVGGGDHKVACMRVN